MNRKRMIGFAVGILISLIYTSSGFCTELCQDVQNKITLDGKRKSANLAKIRDAFQNYQTKYKATDGNYELCFEIVNMVQGSDYIEISNNLEFNVISSDHTPIYVVNLKLKRADSVSDAKPFLHVVSNDTTSVTFQGLKLENVKTGLSLEGTGLYDVTGAAISGDASKSGTCVDIKSAGAVIDGLSLSNCAVPISVSGAGASLKSVSVAGVVASPTPCVAVSGANAVMQGLSLASCANGVVVSGTGAVITGSAISGDASKSGTCIDLKADNAIVKSSDISSCGEGVRIEANNVLVGADSLEKYNTEPSDKNSIHQNHIAIKLTGGGNGKFTYNYLYGNGVGNLAGVLPISFEDTFKKYSFESDDEGNRLFCKKDKDEKILSRYIKLTEPAKDEIISLYFVYATPLSSALPEVGKIIAECKVKDDKTCEINYLSPRLGISDSECGSKDLAVVALATDQKTSGYSDKFTLGNFTLDIVASIIVPDAPGPDTGTADLRSNYDPANGGSSIDGIGMSLPAETNGGSSIDGIGVSLPAETNGGNSIDGIGVSLPGPSNGPATGTSPVGVSTTGSGGGKGLGCLFTSASNAFAYFIFLPLAAARVARFLRKRKL